MQNTLWTRKSVAVYIKIVKTQETFSSPDQKLVETTILWPFLETKILQRNFAVLRIASLVELNKWRKMITSRCFSSQTLSSNMEETNRITDEYIKTHVSRKNLSSKSKHYQLPLTIKQCITNPKEAPLTFKFVKTRMSSSQDQKERKITSTVTKTSFRQKTQQREFASATITTPVDLMNATSLKPSRQLN